MGEDVQRDEGGVEGGVEGFALLTFGPIEGPRVIEAIKSSETADRAFRLGRSWELRNVCRRLLAETRAT